MNIMVIGSGGREHALCWKLKQSSLTEKLYCARGNGGTSKIAANIDITVSDNNAVKDFCKEHDIGFVVVGPEAPLASGLADALEEENIKVFGPSYSAARLESSKIFAKQLMGQYNIPTAAFRIFDDSEKAEEYIRSAGTPIVVKADGLAAGKGVIVAENVEEAVSAAKSMIDEKIFGSAGNKIIVEECLEGEEASILVITDGENIIPLVSSQDHKRVFDGDKGPNTGGMGAYSPAPVIDDTMFKEIIETIVAPTIKGLKEEGIHYKGVLYVGVMVTSEGPKVLEFNVRFGDPETQVILPRLRSDLAKLLLAAAEGDISGIEPEWDDRECVCVVISSGGYPGEYEKGKAIKGLSEAEEEGATVFHAGTRYEGDSLVTSGGRVLNVVGMGEDIKEAVANTYKAVEKIDFENMHYRKDIGHRAIGRVKA